MKLPNPKRRKNAYVYKTVEVIPPVQSGELFKDIRRNLRTVRHRALQPPLRGASTQRSSRLHEMAQPGKLFAPKGWSADCQRCELQGKRFHVFAPNPYIVCNRMTDHFEQEHLLECFFCFLKFPSFGLLAKHVLDAHKSEEERSEYRTFNPETWRDEEMLPQPGGGNARSTPVQGARGARSAPAVPFIKVEDLREDPVRAKILAVKTQDTGFNDIVVKLAIGGKSFFWGLKASNENYELLFKAFGDDDNKWVGEEFMIGLRFNDFYEKNFIQVMKAPADKKGKSKD